jgi:DNA primase
LQGLIPDHTIEEIKQRADIVDVVSEYVTLKKAGRNFLGICPFHKEKTPSFTVSREKQMYYCFGCGEGGHVFTFLMKMSDMTFPETARHLAKKMGIVIPDSMTRKERAQYGAREQISRVDEMAAAYFAKNLFSPAGAVAREYLKTRGIGDDVIREFRLGYAEDSWRALRNYFERRKVPLAVVAEAGLVVSRKEEGGESLYDRFRGRLIFPIEDASGRVVAFGGRIIGQGEPKYLNSPETPVFIKGRNLYGLSRAREGIRRKGYAILVEGYFDLIALRNVGIANVLATLGTALTKEQVDLLRRYTAHVVVLFDADEAGRKALERSLQLFLGGGIQGKAVVLPEGYDPDDYVRKLGKESLENIIDRAPSMVDYYIENIVGNRDTLEEKRDAAKSALTFMSGIDDAIFRNLFLKKISEKLEIDQEVLKKEANRSTVLTLPPSQRNAGEEIAGDVDKVELSLILFMLEHPEIIAQVGEAKALDYFSNNDLKSLGETMLASLNGSGEQPFTSSFFLEHLAECPLKGILLRSLFEERNDDAKVMVRFLADTIKQIKRKWYKKRNKSLIMELVKAQKRGDRDLCSRLLFEKEKLLKEEKQI